MRVILYVCMLMAVLTDIYITRTKMSIRYKSIIPFDTHPEAHKNRKLKQHMSMDHINHENINQPGTIWFTARSSQLRIVWPD